MARRGSDCPRCGSEKVTTVQVPRPHDPHEPAQTQRAFRCLGCDTQWVDDDQWQQLHEDA